MPSSARSPSSPRPVSPFTPLTPVPFTYITSRLPSRVDGVGNSPPPLPRSHAALERRLTSDADMERQMAMRDEEVGPPPEGGKEAWGCVAGAFLVLFCVFGFGESRDGNRWEALTGSVTSFGQLESYYLKNQLKAYSKSSVA